MELVIASQFKHNIIYSGLATHLLPQRRWQVSPAMLLLMWTLVLIWVGCEEERDSEKMKSETSVYLLLPSLARLRLGRTISLAFYF